MKFCLSSLKSRINHSGKLTIPFLYFVSPMGVFQHLKQSLDNYCLRWNEEGACLFSIRANKKWHFKRFYDLHHCNQICLVYLNKPDSEICSWDALAEATKLFFYNGIANIGGMKLHIFFILIRKAPRRERNCLTNRHIYIYLHTDTHTHLLWTVLNLMTEYHSTNVPASFVSHCFSRNFRIFKISSASFQ